MAGHTKGPWGLGERDGDYVMIDAPNHSGLASVVWQMEDDRLCGDPSPEKEANARLIAAAPELLEALKWYVENEDVNEGDPENEFWTNGLNRARAVIAKATQP